MRRMTTHLWQELSMELQKLTVIINVGVSGPGVVKACYWNRFAVKISSTLCEHDQAVQHSKLPELDSW